MNSRVEKWDLARFIPWRSVVRVHPLQQIKKRMKEHPLFMAILSSFGTFMIAHAPAVDLATTYLKFFGALFGTALSIWFTVKEYKKIRRKA